MIHRRARGTRKMKFSISRTTTTIATLAIETSQEMRDQENLISRYLIYAVRLARGVPSENLGVKQYEGPGCVQGRFSGRLETKMDERRLAEECKLLGPLLGGSGKRGERSRLTLAKIVRGIASGEVRRHCEAREQKIEVSTSSCSIQLYVIGLGKLLLLTEPLPQELLMRFEQSDGRSSGRLDLPLSSPRHLKEEALNGLSQYPLADTPLASTSEQQPSTSVSQTGTPVGYHYRIYLLSAKLLKAGLCRTKCMLGA